MFSKRKSFSTRSVSGLRETDARPADRCRASRGRLRDSETPAGRLQHRSGPSRGQAARQDHGRASLPQALRVDSPGAAADSRAAGARRRPHLPPAPPPRQRPWPRGSGPAAPAHSLGGAALRAARQGRALSRPPAPPRAASARHSPARRRGRAHRLPPPPAAAPRPGNRRRRRHLSREPPTAQRRRRRRRRDLTRLAEQGAGRGGARGDAVARGGPAR